MDVTIPQKRASIFSAENIVVIAKRYGWMITSLIVIVAGLLFLSNRAGGASVSRSELTFGNVQRGTFSIESRGAGVFKPRYNWWVSAESAATVKSISVRSGDTVVVGQEIMLLSDPVLDETINNQKWDIPILEGNLQKAMSEKSQAILDQEIKIADLERNIYDLESQILTEKNLRENNHSSMGELQWKNLNRGFDYAKMQLGLEKKKQGAIGSNHDSSINVLQNQLEQAKFLRKHLLKKQEKLRVLASRAGIIQDLPVEVGQQVSLGSPLFRIAGSDQYIAEIKISQDEIAEVAVGQSVIVRNRNGQFSGTVGRINGAVENGTVKVEVNIDDELPAGIRADQRVDATITIERLDDAIFVKRPAFVQADKEGWVYKVMPDGGSVKRSRAMFGKASVQEIQIVDGLSPNDKIVLSEPDGWADQKEFYLR